MTNLDTLLGYLDRWVTVTEPGPPHKVWHGRLTGIWDQPCITLETPGGGTEMLPAAYDVALADPAALRPAPDAGEARPWADLRTSGMLWWINRVAFHPRGLALAVHVDDDGEFSGWSLLTNEEGEPWIFDTTTDYDGHRRAEDTITAALTSTDTVRTECPDTIVRPLLADEKQLQPYPAYDTRLARCSVCSGGPVAYDNYQGDLFCWRCADCDCGRDLCLRTGLHQPAEGLCTATWARPHRGLIHCEGYAGHYTSDYCTHQGRTPDRLGALMSWRDGDTGSTPHQPTDTVRTPETACPDTDPVVRTDDTPDPPTSTDTAQEPCPDTVLDPGTVPRHEHLAAIARSVRETNILRDRVGELAKTLSDVLGHFTVHADIGGKAVRTGYLDPQTVNRWRSIQTGKASADWAFPHVEGRCPACNHGGLILGSGGYVTCPHHDCPSPDAPGDFLTRAPTLATAEDRALNYCEAYDWLRADVRAAADYIARQRSANFPFRGGDSRRYILTHLARVVKDPGPVLTPAGGR